MKKKTLLLSILSIIMCLSLTVGGTFALFTSKSEVNIAVTSGTVNVTAEVKSYVTGTTLGGDAYVQVSDNQDGSYALATMVAGDYVDFVIDIANNSDVSVKYRIVTKLQGDLANDLVVSITDENNNVIANTAFTPWVLIGSDVTDLGTYTIKIAIPEKNETANGGKTASIYFAVEAIQGNAETVDEVYETIDTTINEQNLTEKDEIIGEVSDPAQAKVPAGTELKDGANTLTLQVNEAKDGAMTNGVTIIGADVKALDVKIPEVSENNSKVITVTLFGHAKGADKVEIFHEDVKMSQVADMTNPVADTFTHDKVTGDVTIAVTNFSNFTSASYVLEYDNVRYDAVIYNASDLKAFRDDVNAGNNYQGKKVYLANDIDLANEEWAPIGYTGSFNGLFNGNDKVISNLKVSGYKSNVGLFGNTYNGEIKNLTVKNANVSGRLNVGVVAGNPYTTKYNNIKVLGHVEVNGMAYVGGVGGKNAYTNWTNIEVNVDETSYVKAVSIENGNAYRTYVGGVIGFMGEGGHAFTNVTSNIDVIGSTIDVGGITGIAHYGNKFINCKSSGDVTTEADNVEDALETGGIAGVWYNGGSIVTLENCEFTGKLYAPNCEDVDLSNNVFVGAPYSANSNGMLIVNGEYVVTFADGAQSIPTGLGGKKVTLIGTGKTEITVTKVATSGENCDYLLDSSTATFDNFIIKTNSSTYIGYARLTATFNNCTFEGTYTTYQNTVFNNCTFNVSGDVYNIWTWGAPEATFNGCTFNSDGKAILLYGGANTKLTVNDCTFNDNGGLTDLKAAIEIGNDYGTSYELIVNNTTVNGYEINDKGINTNTTLWANKNSMGTDKLNVVVDGVDVY